MVELSGIMLENVDTVYLLHVSAVDNVEDLPSHGALGGTNTSPKEKHVENSGVLGL